MSGIFGVVENNSRVELDALLTKMQGVLAHFDWHQVETHCDQSRGVGLGRVGIGLFNSLPQPVWDESGTAALVMAGEIYNKQALHQFAPPELPDEQFVLKLYKKLGATFVRYLKGVFAIAIWDNAQQQLIITNDRFGTYPMYYGLVEGRLVFGPEMKAIFCDSSFPKKLDLTALAQYLRFQFLLEQRTFFENLQLLPNASILSYTPEKPHLQIEKYWDISQIPTLPASLTFNEAVVEASRRLKAAVDRLCQGNYRLGVYLSAGVDSRVILGLINPNLGPVTTVTYGHPQSRDVVYARRIAKIMATNHHYFAFNDGRWVQEFAPLHLALTEGEHSWIHSHGISIGGESRQLMDVNLTGFAGGVTAVDWQDSALWFAEDNPAFETRLFALLNQETTWPSLTEAEEATIYHPNLAGQLRGRAFCSLQQELAAYSHLSPYQRAIEFAVNNSDRRLFMNYVVFQRAFLEQRFPFLDYDYAEFVYALPPEMLAQRRLRRAAILKMMPRLAPIPYDKDDLPITSGQAALLRAKVTQKGKNFVNRHITPIFPKYHTLYADYENWLRHELGGWGEDLLLSERTLQRGLFNPDGVRSLWRRHQTGLEMHTIGKLAPLMTYELLLRRFLDE